MPTLVPLFVRRMSVQPDGAVIVVLLPPLTVIPATSTSSFAIELGLLITIVLAPEELFTPGFSEPNVIEPPPEGVVALLRSEEPLVPPDGFQEVGVAVDRRRGGSAEVARERDDEVVVVQWVVSDVGSDRVAEVAGAVALAVLPRREVEAAARRARGGAERREDHQANLVDGVGHVPGGIGGAATGQTLLAGPHRAEERPDPFLRTVEACGRETEVADAGDSRAAVVVHRPSRVGHDHDVERVRHAALEECSRFRRPPDR